MLFSLKAKTEVPALLIADDLATAGSVFLSSWRTGEGLPWIRGFEPNQGVPPQAALAQEFCSSPSMQAELEVGEDLGID